MANVPESATFDAGIYQLEITDAVIGGVNGISNLQAKGLANRTNWLKAQVDALNLLKGTGIAAFSTGSSYAGGQQVIYQKNIWQANTAISPGAFNPANWTRQLGVAAESALADAVPLMDGTAAVGTSTDLAREDHVHPIDTTRAPLASPVLTGNPTGPTAPQFDTDFSLATTEFVQRALGSFSGGRDENGTGLALPTSDVGKYVALALGAAQTVVLPLLTSVPVGSTITLHNSSTFDKIVTVAGDNQISPNGYTSTSVILKQGDTASFTSEASMWRMHGVGALKYSAQFGVSLAASGWQKLPSGLIIQWGVFTAHATAGSPLSITLPIAYPAACRSVQVMGDGSITSAVSVWVDSVSPVTFNARCNIGGQPNCRFIAIGY